MATLPLIEYDDAGPEVRAVYDEIMELRGTDWIKDQESILHVEDGYKGVVYGALEYLATGTTEHIGVMREVSQTEAMLHDGWTYRPDLNKYFIAE